MYVRNNYGIFRSDTIFLNSYGASPIKETDIVKQSENIVDLIEVGDYVNGVEVIHFQDDIFHSYYELANHFLVSRKKPEDIKSIVTKEQFKSVSFEV